MEVYVVVSNNPNQVMGCIEGVFKQLEDAKKCFDEIRQDWLKWAGEDIVEVIDEDDYFVLTTSEETMEVEIVEKEVL